MPIRNEAGYIRRSLGSVLAQEYPGDRIEILIVDGMSTDGTRERIAGIVEEQAAQARAAGRVFPPVQVLDNPASTVPPAMNIGLQRARGDILIRVDGHCEIHSSYVHRCVEVLQATGAECAGGPMVTVGETFMARAIALAQSSRFGVGGVAFRTGRERPGFVDTVAFGAYQRDVFPRIGGFDEELVRNQDDEFNFRLTQAGGHIWLDPGIQSTYFSRATLGSLWRQYFQYGFYKVRVIQKRGAVASWRHLVPGGFVAAILLSLLAALGFWDWRWLLPVLGSYLVTSVLAGVWAAGRDVGVAPVLPLVFTVLHVSYGSGFLWGILRWLFRSYSPPTGVVHPILPDPGAAQPPRRLRIGILTQYYPPEIGAPQVRLSELAKCLRRRGHEVVVLTAMPNYPLGRMYPGYRGFYCRELRDGIRVLRTTIFPTKSVEMVPRLTNYFSFVISALFVGWWKLPKLDYLITESPPLFLGATGFLLAKSKGSRWIFNVSDLWPDSAVRLGVLNNRFYLFLARRLESFVYRKAWLVTGQSQETLDNIHARFPAVRTYRVSNGVDLDTFSPERRAADARRRLVPEGWNGVVAMYAGLHGLAQGLEQILQAAEQLRDLTALRFVFVGDGPEKDKLTRWARDHRLDNVAFLDPVPAQDVPNLVGSAEIGLVPLRVRLPGAIPSKLYETMACGLPIVLVAEGEPMDIVLQTDSGMAVRPGDIAGLATALRTLTLDAELRRRLGRNGRNAAQLRYDRTTIQSQFAALLEAEDWKIRPRPATPSAATVSTVSA